MEVAGAKGKGLPLSTCCVHSGWEQHRCPELKQASPPLGNQPSLVQLTSFTLKSVYTETGAHRCTASVDHYQHLK